MTEQDGKTPISNSQSYSHSSSASDNEDIFKGLPNYLTNPSKKGDIHDIMIDANEECNEICIGYGSNSDTEEINDIDNKVHLIRLFNLASIADKDFNKDVHISDRNMVEKDFTKTRYGIQDLLMVHKEPKDWGDLLPVKLKNEPQFKLVDNHDNYGSSYYRLVFKKENSSIV